MASRDRTALPKLLSLSHTDQSGVPYLLRV